MFVVLKKQLLITEQIIEKVENYIQQQAGLRLVKGHRVLVVVLRIDLWRSLWHK